MDQKEVPRAKEKAKEALLKGKEKLHHKPVVNIKKTRNHKKKSQKSKTRTNKSKK
jgi:hypothetical protein